MSGVGVLLVHGRSQELAVGRRSDTRQVEAHTAALKEDWLNGLDVGLSKAGYRAVNRSTVEFPFYGNLLANLAEPRALRGDPDLEAFDRREQAVDELTFEAAECLGYRASKWLSRSDPAAAKDAAVLEKERAADNEVDLSDLLGLKVVQGATQFLAEKTGASRWIIRQRLKDVGYYLSDSAIREQVLECVRSSMHALTQKCETMVIISHSLGSIVTYDLLSEDHPCPVGLFITAGSPLGLPVVQRNLLNRGDQPKPRVPNILRYPETPPWLNAFDARDIVAVASPLKPRFEGGDASIQDEQTYNVSYPHSIYDYLSDPDVAEPIAVRLGLETKRKD